MSQGTSQMDNAIDQVLEIARRGGVELEILGFEKADTAISFQKAKMDQFSLSETRQLGVRVIDGKHEGVAYTESLDGGSLEQTVNEARANARAIQHDWIAGLTEAGRLPSLDGLYNAALDEVPVESKIKAAATLQETALSYDARITSVPYSKYGDVRRRQWVANTRGLRGSFALNSCFVYTYCLAKDGDVGVMDGDVAMVRGFEKMNPAAVAKEAARRTIDRIGSTRPQTGRYTVVFDSRTSESLVGMISSYFSAKAVDEKTSPLGGKLGERVFSQEFNLTDDPLTIAAWGARPFDDEGYASRATTLVENGVVKSFLTNSVLARKLGLAHTASASRAPSTDLDVSASNLLVKPGTRSQQELLAADAKVIHITSVKGGAGFRATSGDFSLPVEGFMYENGKRGAPLKDFLMSGNILQLFGSIEAVGNDSLPPTGSIVCPPLLVRDLNISGQS